MPGPGGGSRGGGFGRSGGGSGGFGGGGRGGFGGGPRPGGFHRPPHHHHHHHYRPFWGFHYPFFGYGYRGGCLGGAIGMIMLPIILFFIMISLVTSLFGSVGSSVSNIASGGQWNTNDAALEEYALERYYDEFGDSESAILIVFLADEGCEDFYTMAIVGYNIHDDINEMFGGRYTEYGEHLIENLNSNYKNTLSRNLSATIRNMTDEVVNLRLKSSFYDTTESTASLGSHVRNLTTIKIDETTLNNSLESFTEATEIPIVIVIEDMGAIFKKSVRGNDIITVLLALIISGAGIYFIICAVKGKDNNPKDDDKDYFDKTGEDDRKRRREEDRKNNSTSW